MLQQQHKLTLLLSVCLLGVSSTSFAATDSDEAATAYVDSINGWGSWELGLEPAAGGTPPSPSRTLSSRAANVKFRPNDNSTFSPDSRAVVATTSPTPMPPAIPAPVIGGSGPLPTGDHRGRL